MDLKLRSDVYVPMCVADLCEGTEVTILPALVVRETIFG